jgi:hypothetical protein
MARPPENGTVAGRGLIPVDDRRLPSPVSGSSKTLPHEGLSDL